MEEKKQDENEGKEPNPQTISLPHPTTPQTHTDIAH
jgi:hypothetical protein